METPQFPVHGLFLPNRMKARNEGCLMTSMGLEKKLWVPFWIDSWEAPGLLRVSPGVQTVTHLSSKAVTRVCAGGKAYLFTVLDKSSSRVV